MAVSEPFTLFTAAMLLPTLLTLPMFDATVVTLAEVAKPSASDALAAALDALVDEAEALPDAEEAEPEAADALAAAALAELPAAIADASAASAKDKTVSLSVPLSMPAVCVQVVEVISP